MQSLRRVIFSLLFTSLLSASLTGHAAQEQSYAEDRARIENLLARYSFAIDFKDADAYAALFAEDAVLDWAGGEIEGREAIRQFMLDGVYNLNRDAEEAAWPATTRHFITNVVVTVDGDTASAMSYWFQTNNNSAERTPYYGLFGHSEDQMVRIDGEWFFARREIYNEGIPARARAGQENPVE